MASNHIILPDSFSLQRGLQQALGDPANSCREEEEADMILLISQSVHTIFVQSFAVQLRNTFKFILYIRQNCPGKIIKSRRKIDVCVCEREITHILKLIK